MDPVITIINASVRCRHCSSSDSSMLIPYLYYWYIIDRKNSVCELKSKIKPYETMPVVKHECGWCLNVVPTSTCVSMTISYFSLSTNFTMDVMRIFSLNPPVVWLNTIFFADDPPPQVILTVVIKMCCCWYNCHQCRSSSNSSIQCYCCRQ